MLFVRLPSFQQEEAVIGARNYIEFYRLDKPEDTTGQYSVNAANFLDNMMFTEFQSKNFHSQSLITVKLLNRLLNGHKRNM